MTAARKGYGILTLIALSAFSLLACDARELCEKEYPARFKARACQTGAKEIAPQIAESLGKSPTPEQAEALCREKCTSLYSLDRASLGSDDQFFKDLASLDAAVQPCRAGCTQRLAWMRFQAEENTGCVPMVMGGGLHCFK